MKKERESNFELMRLVSMIFIILWHVIGHGKIVENSQNPAVDTIFSFLKHVIIVHVNSFVLILGFFQYRSKVKTSKVISLIFQTLFYSIVIFFTLYKLGFIDYLNFAIIMNVLIPFSSIDYWFISSYLLTYVLSNYINIFLKSLSYKQLKKLIIICFVTFCIIPFITGMRFINNNGYNFYHFIFLYIVGVYLYRYPLKESFLFRKISLKGYRLILLFIFFFCASYNFFLYGFAVNHLYNNGQVFNYISNVILLSQGSYASPLVIVQSICYFEFFRTLCIKSKIINFISSCVFGIYLFHENTYLRIHLYKLLKIDNGIFYGRRIFVDVIIALIIIFVTGIIIELIRKLIAKIIVKTSLYKKMRVVGLQLIK